MSSNVYGIIPAAGRSRRMGRDKQLIEVDGRAMLEIVIGAMLDGGAAGVFVVTRRDIFDALAALVRERVMFVENADAQTEMIDSVRLGIGAVRRERGMEAADGVAVCPGDFPGLRAKDVRACVDVFAAQRDRIVIATHEGRRGHPIIVPASLCDVVMSAECDGGLNALPRMNGDRVVEVERASEGVIRDVDRPEDLD